MGNVVKNNMLSLSALNQLNTNNNNIVVTGQSTKHIV